MCALGAPGPAVTYTIDNASGVAVGSFTTPVYLLANRVDPRYGRVIQDENGLKSYYDALAVELNKRFAHGLEALVSYTWAHSIDDGQGAAGLLHDHLRTRPLQAGQRQVTVGGRDGQPPREAVVRLAFAAVEVLPPQGHPGHYRKVPQKVWAIRLLIR